MCKTAKIENKYKELSIIIYIYNVKGRKKTRVYQIILSILRAVKDTTLIMFMFCFCLPC